VPTRASVLHDGRDRHHDAPGIEGPRSLPAIRSHLVEMWRPGSAYDRSAARANAEAEGAGNAAEPYAPAFERNVLANGKMWWVDADACAVLNGSAGTFPADHRLLPDDPPHLSGMAVFATPVQGLDANRPGVRIPLSVLLWGPLRLKAGRGVPGGTLAIGLSWYGLWDFDAGLDADQLNNPVVQVVLAEDAGAAQRSVKVVMDDGGGPRPDANFAVHGRLWVPLGRSDWIVDSRVDDQPAGLTFTPSIVESMVEDRRLAGTLWHLARQPHVIETAAVQVPRPKPKFSKARAPRPDEVHVMRLRTLDGRRGPQATREVVWRHRWMVRAHWRMQPFGPGSQQRRPTLIAPYLKGPDGAPLKPPTATVYRLENEP